MSLKKVVFTKDSLWETLNLLAASERVMFVEPRGQKSGEIETFAQGRSKHFQNLFEMMDFVEQKMGEFELSLPSLPFEARSYIADLDRHWQNLHHEGDKSLEEIEEKFKSRVHSLKAHLDRYYELKSIRAETSEKILALKEIDFGGRAEELMDTKSRGMGRLHWIVGLIHAEHLLSIQKLIFRISRENVIMRSASLGPVVDAWLRPGELRPKTLVWICVPRGEGEVLGQRIQNVLAKFGLFGLDREQSLVELIETLNENSEILRHTHQEAKEGLIEFVKQGFIPKLSKLQELRLIFKREENFTRQFRFLSEKGGFYELSFWVPASFARSLVSNLDRLGSEIQNFTKPQIFDVRPASGSKPPTRLPADEFVSPFQQIVNTYGVPRYKEANPALFTIATFPFMFGLMFGDVGHGALLLATGVYLCLFLRNKQSPFFAYRYLVLMMGIFALYCGLIYSEFFSVPLVLSQSCWKQKKGRSEFIRRKDCVPPFGLDYIWFQSSNETLFVNSFKMKFAIVIGVAQMLLGLGLKVANSIHFRSKIDLFCEALPQMLFMLVTFGYMVFCIVVKWLINWSEFEPPSIISLFINFYEVRDPLFSTAETQQSLQRTFMIIAGVCVILMLVPKPLLAYFSSRKIKAFRKLQARTRKLQDSEGEVLFRDDFPNELSQLSTLDPEPDTEHEKEELGEMIVHQMIETVEFVLGSISNTASYLRLWALSLAHAQLSKVFLSMIFANSLKNPQSILSASLICIIGTAFWFAVTLGIIMGMDLLECFLHALRLHWVEFQNKFFKGDGVPFEPFKHIA